MLQSRHLRYALLSALAFLSLAVVGAPEVASACETCSPRATCYDVAVGFKNCKSRGGLFTRSCFASIECPLRYSPVNTDGETPEPLQVASKERPADLFSTRGSGVRSACLAGQNPPHEACRIQNGKLLASCEATATVAESLPAQQSIVAETRAAGGRLALSRAASAP